MSLIDTLIATFAPYDCLGCGTEGRMLCRDCSMLFGQIPERCYRCRKLSPANKTCKSCYASSNLRAVQSVTTYEFIAKDLVWHLKFQGAQAAASEMARQMLPHVKAGTVLVHVPTATARVRQRGYDQARLITRSLSSYSGVPCQTLLGRMGQHHQVGASREQRTTQLKTAFRVINRAAVKDTHIILVDDVLTTGATLEAAARVLKAAGAKRVDGLVFAQA